MRSASWLERGLKPRAGGVVAILSTVQPKPCRTSREKASGMHVIYSTVCRGGEPRTRELLSSSAAAEVVARITPVLRAYSADVVHTGDVGRRRCKGRQQPDSLGLLVADARACVGAAVRTRPGEACVRRSLMSSATNDALEKWGRQTRPGPRTDMADHRRDCAAVAVPPY